ncbi:MAG: VCBS repeat-containing protein [Bdellovibrionales bacterium]|nr:VCBS repeat-containing protein [Bdellovibrionales bacterium]
MHPQIPRWHSAIVLLLSVLLSGLAHAQQSSLATTGEFTSLGAGSISVDSIVYEVPPTGVTVQGIQNEKLSLGEIQDGDVVTAIGSFDQTSLILASLRLVRSSSNATLSAISNPESEDLTTFTIEGQLTDVATDSVTVGNETFAIDAKTTIDDGVASLTPGSIPLDSVVRLTTVENTSDTARAIVVLRRPASTPGAYDGTPTRRRDVDFVGVITAITPKSSSIQEISVKPRTGVNARFLVRPATRIVNQWGRPIRFATLTIGDLVIVDAVRPWDMAHAPFAKRIKQFGKEVTVRGRITGLSRERVRVGRVSAKLSSYTTLQNHLGKQIPLAALKIGQPARLRALRTDNEYLVAENVTVLNQRRTLANLHRAKTVYRPNYGLWLTDYAVDEDNDGISDVDSHQWGLPSDVPLRAVDIDGDLVWDPAVFRPSTGGWYVLKSSTGYEDFEVSQWGMAGDIPVPGDYDGDSLTDLAVWRPAIGYWFILLSSSGDRTRALAASDPRDVLVRQWGLSNHVPIAGADVDGDGRDDLVTFDPQTGYWHVLFSSSGFNREAALAGSPSAGESFQFGLPGDQVVMGDVDGDNIDDAVVWRTVGVQGYFFVRQSATQDVLVVPWGLQGDRIGLISPDGESSIPTAALSVFRPSSGHHFDLVGGKAVVRQWGLAGDNPVSIDLSKSH